MRQILLSVLLALGLAAPAGATPRDDMTALIAAGDVEAVRAALSDPDRAVQRQHFAAFQTSRPDAGKLSEALLAADPGDPRAMTARGWYLMARGWALRGTGYARTVYADGLAQMEAMHGEAWALALAALDADPTLVPASDLVLQLARTTGHRRTIPAELDRVMQIWPNRQSLLLAVFGMTPAWGGPPGWGPEACEAYAERIADVEGYTPEVCTLDILWAANYRDADRAPYADRLIASDHPILEGARLAWATSWRMPDAEARVVLEGATGDLTLSQARILDAVRGEGGSPGGGPAYQKALKVQLPRLRAEADFDPGNSYAVLVYIDALIEASVAEGRRVPRDEIEARYGMLFKLAPYDSGAWARYGVLLQDSLDFQRIELSELDAIRGYMENAVYYTNHDSSQLAFLDGFNRIAWDALDRRNLDAIDATGTTAFPKEAYEASVICPTIRAVRLLQAICEADPAAGGCPPPGGNALPWDEQMARAEKRDACVAERTADLRDLLYTPVAVPLPGD